MFGSSSSKTNQTSTAAQSTSNSDNGSTSSVINLAGISVGKKATANITVESLDAATVRDTLTANFATTGAALDFAQNNANRAFDSLDATSSGFLGLLKDQQQEATYASIRAADLSGSVARDVLALADDKTTTTDERLIGLVKIGLAVVAVIVAALVIFPRRNAKKKKAE